MYMPIVFERPSPRVFLFDLLLWSRQKNSIVFFPTYMSRHVFCPHQAKIYSITIHDTHALIKCSREKKDLWGLIAHKRNEWKLSDQNPCDTFPLTHRFWVQEANCMKFILLQTQTFMWNRQDQRDVRVYVCQKFSGVVDLCRDIIFRQ
jgi:hypothetical protein